MKEEVIKDERRGGTSASNAAADAKCAGRHQAQKGMPDIASPDATFGTQIHDALSGKIKPSELSEEQLSIYESCLEITDKLMKEVFGADAAKAALYRERRFWVKVLAVSGDKSKNPATYHHSGKIDFAARIEKKALIIEYKSLPGDLESSPTNAQLRDQVVLLAGNLGLDEVITAVVQPLVTHNPEMCRYNTDAIKKAEQEMFVRVRASNNPNAKRTPHPVACKFCLARSVCVEYQEWSASQLPDTKPVAGIPVKDWTPEQRAHFCNMKGVARQWLDDCEAEMKRLLKEDAAAVPGWRLKPGAVQSPITDPQELFRRFNQSAQSFAAKELPDDPEGQRNLILDLFMQCVKISKSDLSAKVRAISGLKGKKLEAHLNGLLEGITDSKQNAESLSKEA